LPVSSATGSVSRAVMGVISVHQARMSSVRIGYQVRSSETRN
jgi:hypothetical protein